MKKRGLGKGVGALFGENTKEKPTKTEEKESMTLPIADIEPNPLQPRKKFEEDSLLELADSMKHVGVLQPIIVKKKDKTYEIVTGERRWRAAKLAGLKEMPVIIKELTEKELAQISLIENIQRENLNIMEEANAYKRLLEEFQLTHDELANQIGKSRTAITNTLRLLALSDAVQKMTADGMLSMGHARSLLAVTDETQQAEIAMMIFDHQLSVRETENYIKNLNKEPKEKTLRKLSPELKAVEKRMSEHFGSKVKLISRKNNSGKIEINYNTLEDLERIMDILDYRED
ncbi:MAG: ParB/RepB/Spo0J family partition protein [Eubacteriales bacterium]|nr:ParB/RepB/Spo0J family partition protein [Eubacteriales bacterium]